MLMLHIASKEFKSLFISPLGWSILAVVQFIVAYLFLSQVNLYVQFQPGLSDSPGLTEIVVLQTFNNVAIILLLVIPLLTMRMLSEEFRNKTVCLLFSAPISMTEIIIGKYLGLLGFIALLLGMIMLMPLSLLIGGVLDWGLIFSGILGLSLLLSSFAAIGLYMSSLTSYPSVAAVTAFGVLLGLWIIDWTQGTLDEKYQIVLGYISIFNHYESLLNGVFSSSDVVYYLLLIITFITLSVRQLSAYRTQY